jgi:glyoxylase-like metal-dependent hydrolase (beta-lactamase superfamily II)
MEIYSNVHLIPKVIANPFLLIDPNGLVLIDAGMPGSDKKILRYITKLGFAPKDLKYIIITHADFDHVGGLAALKKASGARVLASAPEAAAMAEGHSSREIHPTNSLLKMVFGIMGRFEKNVKVEADELLSDGQIIPILGGLQVIETIGHTPGHISLFLVSAGILFSGDSIVTEKDKLYSSRSSVTWDRQEADKSVRRQAGLEVKIVCPGHGPVVVNARDKFPTV